MKNNFNESAFKPSMPADFKTEEFVKITNENKATLIGLPVVGIMASNKGRYGLSFSLACLRPTGPFFLNIPRWLGERIDKDFQQGDGKNQTVEEYFKGVTIAGIEAIETPNGASWELTFKTT